MFCEVTIMYSIVKMPHDSSTEIPGTLTVKFPSGKAAVMFQVWKLADV